MRYPFQVIKEWQIPLTPLPKTYPATAAFLELMVTLDELFDEFPAVLRLPEGTALTLLYRDVVYSDQDILNSVGGLACHISETCSLTFYGTTEHRETAEMTVRPGSSPKKGRVLTRSLSGRPIRRLQGLGVRLDLGDRDAADHLTVMARALAASGGPWGVVSRQHEAFVHKCGLLGKPLLLLCLGKRPSPTAPHRTDRGAQGPSLGVLPGRRPAAPGVCLAVGDLLHRPDPLASGVGAGPGHGAGPAVLSGQPGYQQLLPPGRNGAGAAV